MRESPRSPVQTIADQVAALYKAQYGRGPTNVSVHLALDAVVCILRDVNTPAQNALVRFGAVEVAQATHHRLQIGMSEDLIAIVERTTGRAVETYIPGFNAPAGATTDVFLFARGEERPAGCG